MADSDDPDDDAARSKDDPRFERDVELGLLDMSDEKLHDLATRACRREARRGQPHKREKR